MTTEKPATQSDEDFILAQLPTLDDLVSEENPIPWREWLPKRCEVRAWHKRATYWGASNCNYIVYRDHVFQNYGYHGRNTFNALTMSAFSREEYFQDFATHKRTLNELLGRIDNLADSLQAARKRGK